MNESNCPVGKYGYMHEVSVLGLRGWLLCRLYKRCKKRLKPHVLFPLASKDAKYLLKCRIRSSDFDVFRQIFLEREYSCLDDVSSVGLVIDCGANVGYSSAYFLSRFPDCKVVAVEPDQKNFEVLRLNLLPYGSRAVMYQAAVWSHVTELTMSESSSSDGYEWGRQVRECRSMENVPKLPTVDIGGLLRDAGFSRISILKVDIEGAEAVVFADDHASWLDHVDNLVIEIHHRSPWGDCAAVVEKAMSGKGFHMSKCGELSVYKRTLPKEPNTEVRREQ